MDLHGFAAIRDFRVRLPEPVYPYRGKQSIEACHVLDLPKDGGGWFGIAGLSDFFPAKFSERNPLNIPGPIYGAETDTCTTGPAEAPLNVLLDEAGQEFVFKQPSTAIEFRDVLSAALCECFHGYGADGDSNWRQSSIREWWQNRDEMFGCLCEEFCDPNSVLRWREGLNGAFEPYLRVYAFFVENGRAPGNEDTLPSL
jgi:hypothetical protein